MALFPDFSKRSRNFIENREKSCKNRINVLDIAENRIYNVSRKEQS